MKPDTVMSNSQIALAIANYWAVSISMVFVNKLLMSGDGAIDAPLFVTWYQCACTVVLCWLIGSLGLAGMPRFDLRRDLLIEMLPLSVVFLLMILTNNLCLKYVEVSFYQVARCLTMVFNVILTYFMLHETTSLPALAACGVVLFGFVLGNQQEIHWSARGLAYGVASSLFVALNTIYVKKKLPIVDYNSWRITFYNNFNVVILLFPIVLMSGEVDVIMNSPLIFMPSYWAMMTLGGFLGTSIGLATAYQIQATSPLTHNISGTAKAAAQTLLALWLFQNPITGLGLLSIGLVLGGSMVYTMVRRNEMIRSKEESASKAVKQELVAVNTR